VDLDGDGRLDLVSGSWPGEIFFFRGKGKGEFDPPVKLKDKNGKTINVGGGICRDSGGNIVSVAGDATWEETDKGTVILYEGQRIDVPADRLIGVTGTASTVHAVDWDSDGLIDLLVGEIHGLVFLVPNEGTPKKWAFGKERQLLAGGKPLRVNGDAAPFACDWDGDGKLDLLVGAGDGSVWFFRNISKNKVPELAAGVQLVPPGEAGYGPKAPREPRRGVRAKVCAVDWNHTGQLDLLVGDFATQKTDHPEASPQQKIEHDKLRQESKALVKRNLELAKKLSGPTTKDERAKVHDELDKIPERLKLINEQIPRECEIHGWVWLFKRNPTAVTASAVAEVHRRTVWRGTVPGPNQATLLLTFEPGDDFDAANKGRIRIDCRYDVEGVEHQGQISEYEYEISSPGKARLRHVSKLIEGKERISPEERTTVEWQYRETKPNELEIQLKMQLQGEMKIRFSKREE
jgi:hypothetical protein